MATELEVLYAKRRANIMKAYAISEQIEALEKRKADVISERDALDNEIVRIRNKNRNKNTIIVGS